MEPLSDYYQFIMVLGHGTFGQVLLVQDKITTEHVAMKFVRKDRTRKEEFLKELSISVRLSDYQGIITTYPIYYDAMDYYILTQELATAGTLQQLVQPKVGIPEDAVKRCAEQLSEALDYMHSLGLVHMDVKPDNVFLMDRDCHHIKLGDFGLSHKAGHFLSTRSHIIPSMSPELCDVRDDEYLILSPSVDTWALGILLFFTLTGEIPWKKAVEGDLRYSVYMFWRKYVNHLPPPDQWQRFTGDVLNMFGKLLSRDPSTRPSILCVQHYLHYPWIASPNNAVVVGENAEKQQNQSWNRTLYFSPSGTEIMCYTLNFELGDWEDNSIYLE